MDSRRMPSQADLLLRNSPLFEHIYPLIPFHALPFSLSLSGEKNSPKPEFTAVWKHGSHTRKDHESCKCYGFTAMVSRVAPPSGSTEKRYSPPPLPFWEINIAYMTPLKILTRYLMYLHLFGLADSWWSFLCIKHFTQATSFSPLKNAARFPILYENKQRLRAHTANKGQPWIQTQIFCLSETLFPLQHPDSPCHHICDTLYVTTQCLIQSVILQADSKHWGEWLGRPKHLRSPEPWHNAEEREDH